MNDRELSEGVTGMQIYEPRLVIDKSKDGKKREERESYTVNKGTLIQFGKSEPSAASYGCCSRCPTRTLRHAAAGPS